MDMNQEAVRFLLQQLSQPLVNIVTSGQSANVSAATCVATSRNVSQPVQTTRQMPSATCVSLETPSSQLQSQ